MFTHHPDVLLNAALLLRNRQQALQYTEPFVDYETYMATDIGWQYDVQQMDMWIAHILQTAWPNSCVE